MGIGGRPIHSFTLNIALKNGRKGTPRSSEVALYCVIKPLASTASVYQGGALFLPDVFLVYQEIYTPGRSDLMELFFQSKRPNNFKSKLTIWK